MAAKSSLKSYMLTCSSVHYYNRFISNKQKFILNRYFVASKKYTSCVQYKQNKMNPSFLITILSAGSAYETRLKLSYKTDSFLFQILTKYIQTFSVLDKY